MDGGGGKTSDTVPGWRGTFWVLIDELVIKLTVVSDVVDRQEYGLLLQILYVTLQREKERNPFYDNDLIDNSKPSIKNKNMEKIHPSFPFFDSPANR